MTPSPSCVGTLCSISALGFVVPSAYVDRRPGVRRPDAGVHVPRRDQSGSTAPDIRARKGGEPIVSLTSYHAHTARLRRPVTATSFWSATRSAW